MDWTYVAIMAAAVATGLAVYSRTQQPRDWAWWEQASLMLGTFCGSMLGAKLPFLLSDWAGLVDGTAWLTGGKTIVSGLLGGYLGVQVAEWVLGKPVDMCDSFAAPVAAAIAVGRLGCFHVGCCYGSVTSVPWGIDFGDGQPRHPTQLYESLFHVLAAVTLYQLYRRQLFRGQHIRLYFLAYFCYRFLTEFIRPEARLWLGLTGYQWAALFLALLLVVWGLPCCRAQWSWPRWRPRTRRPSSNSPVAVTLKQTRTLCPVCLRQVPGIVFEQHGNVLLRRSCADHGETIALLSTDRRHYYLRNEVPHPPPAIETPCCGIPGHKTCVALLEITQACNLCCPVCYAASPAGPHRSLEELSADLQAFVAARGSLDILQLSGGEPLLHPDLLRVIDYCKSLPIEHVMLNTNGLELVRDRTLAAELARRKPHLELSLQFDGLDHRTHRVLRGSDLLAEKESVLRVICANDLPTTLVCTVVRDVNEMQLGPLLRRGIETPQIRGITYQPATWSGRYDAAQDPLHRLTLADVMRLVVEQSEGLLAEEDFQPLPCGDPNCCSFTFVARKRAGPLIPLTRLARYEDHVDQLADRMNFNLVDAGKCCGVRWRVEDYFRVVVKPFMDRYTYDQSRIDECCIHIIQPGGTAVSFCQFNTLHRPRRNELIVDERQESQVVEHARE